MKTNSFLLFLSFIITLTCFNVNTLHAQGTSNKFVVVLDAGHGGKDPGRPTRHGYKESGIALKIVLKLGDLLEKNPNVKVIYTRKTDMFLELRERAAIANKADADLFISIHCNAHHTQAYGTETYVLGAKNTDRNFNVAKAENEVIFLEEDYEKHYEGYNPNSPESLIGLTLMQEEYVDQSILLARLIETNFKNKSKRKSRGVKQESLWVLHNTYMPSVLIETGFITNTKEGKYLNSKSGQQEISSSIKIAITDYINSLIQNTGELIIQDDVINDSKEEAVQVYPNVIFKVQIAAGSRKLKPKAYNFKGLNDISREKVNRLYKYYFGNTNDYSRIKQLAKEAKKTGYPTSYIVAFKDGKKISLQDALKSD